MAINIGSITNATFWVNGNVFLGETKELQLPEVLYKMVDHEALGMIGVSELWAGIEKMEMSVMWNSFYGTALKSIGNPNDNLKIQVRASRRDRNSGGLAGEIPVRMALTCQSKGMPSANFKQNENVEAESKLSVLAYRLEIGEEVIFDIDILANIMKVGGVDVLAKYRQNLGI